MATIDFLRGREDPEPEQQPYQPPATPTFTGAPTFQPGPGNSPGTYEENGIPLPPPGSGGTYTTPSGTVASGPLPGVYYSGGQLWNPPGTDPTTGRPPFQPGPTPSPVAPQPTPQPQAVTGWYGTDAKKKSANDRIVQAYQQYTGRTPSEQEVLSQLSGGQHYQDVNVNWAIDQIRRSSEAQQYAAGGAQPTSPPTPTTPLPPTQQNIMAYLGSLDPTKGLSAYKDELWSRFGVRIEGEDKIVLPDGSKYDIIIDYGLQSAKWNDHWDLYGGAGGSGASGAPGVSGVPFTTGGVLGGDIWSDPSLQLLEKLGRYRLDELFQPVDDPYRDQFFKMLEERIKQLQGPAFTDTEESTLRTSATDQLQRDRQAAHDEIDRRLAALGHGKGSGTLVQAHLEVDRQFDQLVNAQQRGFDVYAINTLNQRRDQAVGLGGSAAQLSQGVRDEEQGRRREALTIAAMFPELQSQQLMQANAILTGSPYSGPSIFSQMMQLAGLGNQQQQYSQNANNAFWSGLGSVLYNWGSNQQTSGGTTSGQYGFF